MAQQPASSSDGSAADAAPLTFSAMPDSPFEKGAYFENASKLKMFVGCVPPATGSSPKCCVIFIHGIDDHSARWKHVCEHLAASSALSAVCYMPDCQGHGRSDGVSQIPGVIVSLESVLDDLEFLVRHAAREHKGLPLFIVGHSLGGFYAIQLLAKRPALAQLVTGLVFSGPAVMLNKNDDTWLNWNVVLPLCERVTQIWPSMNAPVKLGTELTHDPTYQEDDGKDTLRGRPIRARMAAAVMRGMKEVQDDKLLERISLPFLILGSEKDTLVAPEGFREIIKQTATPEQDKTITWLNDSWHEIFRELPEIRNKALKSVEEWMAQRLATHKPQANL